MFASYKDIFEQRGASYHKAMLMCPEARRQEFEHLIRVADLSSGQNICDVPSGGGYLQDFLPLATPLAATAANGPELLGVETCPQFAQYGNGKMPQVLAQLDRLPLSTASFDRVVSLAGSHHIKDKLKFFKELHRITAAQGLCCVADVHKDSKVALFLDEVVNRFNSMGHVGDYLDDGVGQLLQQAGFRRVEMQLVDFHWLFADLAQLLEFTRLLFGLDLYHEQSFTADMARVLAPEVSHSGVRLPWQLMFVKAVN